MSVALRAHDKRRETVLVAGPIAHCDLLQLACGWLVRAYAANGRIYVGRSFDAGATWDDDLLAADGATSGDGAAPALARSKWDHLFCWYHTTGGAAVGYRSEDGGASWSQYVSHAGLTYPRLVVQEHRQLLVVHDGDLNLFPSADYGATTGAALAFLAGWPAQLAAARVDHRNTVHVVTRSAADALEWSYTVGDQAVSDRVTLATGKYPALALGTGAGLLLYFSGSTLFTRRLEAGYGAIAASLANPASYRAGYLGAWVARREEWYTLGKVGGALRVRYAPGGTGTWEAPA